MSRWRQKYFTPGMHLLFWSLLIGLPAILVRPAPSWGLPHWFFPATAVFHAGIFYFNAYVLYPRLLTKRLWWLYILSLGAVVILSFQLKLFLLQQYSSFQLTAENRGIVIFGILPFLIAGIIFRLVTDRIRFERLEKEARAEQLASELKFLRSQVSPHFLFNMMTNMVSLARQKSDRLESSLIKLSDLLRYMLYDSQKEKIPIASEMEHITNYVALQKLRFEDTVTVQLHISGPDEHSLIAPMLLVPFIENAFKHGTGLQQQPYIHISLDASGGQLDFSVTNNYMRDSSTKDNNSGIGLVNVKNRLDLLYPGNHTLAVADEHGVFNIRLKLTLS